MTIDSSASRCPRCSADISGEAFYGICAECRRGLRAQFSDQARAVEVVDYEPKMNVTPNAVATKD